VEHAHLAGDGVFGVDVLAVESEPDDIRRAGVGVALGVDLEGDGFVGGDFVGGDFDAPRGEELGEVAGAGRGEVGCPMPSPSSTSSV
jgi:hypothetical protein